MHQRLNIICGNRSERMPLLRDELERQGVVNYMFWDGIYLPSVKQSINAAHKQIVEYAKLAEFSEVLIAEDDFIGTHKNSFKYFLSKKPRTYDMYLSQVYLGDIDENNRVKSFTGMTMYFVHEKFYDTFLATDPHDHIDRSLDGLGDYHVCNPFAFIQRNGWSSNTGKSENYDTLLRSRNLFGG
jgi:hypothetical protein